MSGVKSKSAGFDVLRGNVVSDIDDSGFGIDREDYTFDRTHVIVRGAKVGE
jgi:hypothetical protein